MGERTVFLVRHGEMDTEAFAVDGFKAGLTSLGRRQARRTANRLRSMHVDAIHFSTVGRAVETARIIQTAFDGVSCHPSRLLWELPSPSMLSAHGEHARGFRNPPTLRPRLREIHPCASRAWPSNRSAHYPRQPDSGVRLPDSWTDL
jgi:broad specificity phosphatase PhoE